MHHVTMILFMCSIKKYQLAVAIIGVTLDVVMANVQSLNNNVTVFSLMKQRRKYRSCLILCKHITEDGVKKYRIKFFSH